MFLNLVTTNPGEVKELLDNLLPAVVGVFVVYLPLLVLAIVNISKKGMIVVQLQHRVRRWALEIAAVGLFCLLACYVAVDDYRLRNQLYPVNVCYNLYLAFERYAASENYREASRNFRFDARSEHDAEAPEVYVMVVGETARAHNFSLYGYPRDTNPLLSKTPGIIAFPDATTQSNTTHKSVPMLLSAASAEDFERLFHEKGILAAFREAGFHTVFISNQLPNHSFIDFLGEQADEHYFLKEGASAKIIIMIVICCRSWMGYCLRQMLLHPSNTVIGNSSWYFILMVLTLITRSAIPVISLSLNLTVRAKRSQRTGVTC